MAKSKSFYILAFKTSTGEKVGQEEQYTYDPISVTAVNYPTLKLAAEARRMMNQPFLRILKCSVVGKL
jgi:hypothetical protein